MQSELIVINTKMCLKVKMFTYELKDRRGCVSVDSPVSVKLPVILSGVISAGIRDEYQPKGGSRSEL